MAKYAVVVGSWCGGLLVGLLCNLQVLAMSAALMLSPPGFGPGAVGTALLAGFLTAFGLVVNHPAWNRPIGVRGFAVPFALGTFVLPGLAFGSVLAGMLTVAAVTFALGLDVCWRFRAPR